MNYLASLVLFFLNFTLLPNADTDDESNQTYLVLRRYDNPH